jgi:Enoyl-CoA hydratase/isomerase
MSRSQDPDALDPTAASVRLEPHPADERLAILRIERPPLNAFDQAMWDLFSTVAASLHGRTAYRAVVITGGAAHFAAGADVKALLGLTPAEFDARNGYCSEPSTTWRPHRRSPSRRSTATRSAAGASSPSPPTSASPAGAPASVCPR